MHISREQVIVVCVVFAHIFNTWSALSGISFKKTELEIIVKMEIVAKTLNSNFS